MFGQTTKRTHPHMCGSSWIEAQSGPRWAHSRLKRFIDVFVSVMVLPIAVPLMLSTALASAFAFRANPLFRQERRGLNGELITVYKIRSLPESFPADVGKRDLNSITLPTFSRHIRRTHFDEIPQLFNVLRKEMSLVGPRPMIDDVLEQLPDSLRLGRASVLPGVTGPWQISSMGSKPLHECPDLDVRYVAHGSLKMDVKYIWWSVARKRRSDDRQPDMLRSELGGPACQCVNGHSPSEGVSGRVGPVDNLRLVDMDTVSGSDHIDSAQERGERTLQMQSARSRI